MTQEQLSEYADITPGYLSKIEGGFANPSLDVLIAIAESLGITLNDLVYSNMQLNSYEVTLKLMEDMIKDCSATEKEFIYTIIKTFIEFVTEHGIRM